MTKSFGRLTALLLATALAMPLSAGAQDPPKKPEQGKAAPAKPAAPAPAARPAPPPAARAAPPAPRPAPAVHVAPPQRPAPPPQRATAPQRPAPQRAAAPQRQEPAAQRQAPAPNRAVQQQQRIQQRAQERAQRQAPAATRAAQPNSPAAAVQQKTAAPAISAAQTRQQQRAERALQQRENRALRALPPKQRAARQQEIQQQRVQRAQQRQQAAQPNAAAARTNAATLSAPATGARRNGQARVTQQAVRQGRFASRFAGTNANVSAASLSAARASTARVRGGRFAARQAWRQGLRAAFVPWYGPVFYPYAYSDIFDYAFWPNGYDDGYFAYAYDDFFDGVFFGEGGPPPEYAYDDGGAPVPRAAAPTYAAVQQICTQPGNGVTAWPIADIEKKVGLNDEQKQLLGDVKNAGSKAAAVFKASCPSESAFPMTPPGRLGAMTARLDATLEAVQTVRPALEKFYDSLSDEQKERFNQIGPKPAQDNATTGQASADANSCKDQKPGLTNLPIEKIEDAVKPTDAQEADLNKLEEATGQAVSIMQAACPDETPITPPGRMEAMEKRLQAMIEASKTVKPALDNFYGSLTNEQKARFNRIGATLAQNN